MNVKTLFSMGLCLAVLAPAAFADTYTNSNGQRVECHDEQVKGDKGHPVAAPLAGAVVGGVVGNQFGSGRGNDLATVAGAAGGAYAGKKYNDNKTEQQETTRQVCKPVN